MYYSFSLSSTTRYNMRKDNVLVHARFRNMYGLRSMRVLGSKLWNNLPNNVGVCKDYFQFKEHMKKWHSHCQCNCCLMWSLKLIWCHHFLTCTWSHPFSLIIKEVITFLRFEKNVVSLGIVAIVHPWKNNGNRFPQEILAFYCGLERFIAGAILVTRQYFQNQSTYITKTPLNSQNFIGNDSSMAGCWKTCRNLLISICLFL